MIRKRRSRRSDERMLADQVSERELQQSSAAIARNLA